MSAEDLRSALMEDAMRWRTVAPHAGAWLMPEFIAREGVAHASQPLPAGIARGTPKLCFANAYRTVRRRQGFVYVEGYATSPLIHGFLLHHAWVVDGEGRVVDPTLREPEAFAYLGVEIPLADYRKNTTHTNASVLLTQWEGINVRYITQRCPALLDIVPDFPWRQSHGRPNDF